ncbi:MAG: acetylglutamate kinase, partial [Bacteroidales bacterium]|nr:acetylglutamate kinase [Bacteroidales bacterium]
MERLTVLKVGGAVVEDPEALDAFLDGFAALPGFKVLVHGGGRAATKVAAQLGVPTRMVEGRRITDADMLRVVTMVYGGLVNKGVVAALQTRGVNALGLTGADLGCMRAV